MLNLLNMARGKMGLDDALRMMKAAGLDLQVSDVDVSNFEGQQEFVKLAGAAMVQGAKVVKLSGIVQGSPMVALMVVKA